MPKQVTAVPAGAERARRTAARSSGKRGVGKQGRASTAKNVGKGRRHPTARTASNPRPTLSKSGVPLTNELIAKLADEAERGYDLSRARRVGRPSLGRGSGASPRVNVRMSPGLHARANELAAREGKTLSQIAREALERYVA